LVRSISGSTQHRASYDVSWREIPFASIAPLTRWAVINSNRLPAADNVPRYDFGSRADRKGEVWNLLPETGYISDRHGNNANVIPREIVE
jgi:hypothetical protein